MANNSATRDTTVEATSPAKTPDLSVSFAQPPAGPAIAGQELTYTITVTNSVAAASQVTLTDTLPPGVDFVRATGGVVPVDGVLTFNLGDLAENAKVVEMVVVTPRTAGSITTTVSVVTVGADSNPDNNTATQTTTVEVCSILPITLPPPSPSPSAPTPVVDGPTVVRLQRFGFHRQPTWFVISFSGALDPARATIRANYVITEPMAGRRNDPRIPIESVVYDPNQRTVMVHTKSRVNLHRPYRLVVVGSGPHGLTDISGKVIDGDRDGQPGGDYVGRITGKMLVGKANLGGPLFGSKPPTSKPDVANDWRSGARTR
jgi:uncharacterized repeat protein (TIGR01451 family)